MKKLILLLLFIPLVSFGQDKYTGLGGYLKVTEDNAWVLTFQNNEYEYVSDIASIYLQNKSEAIEFINDYEDCVKNIKTINKTKYKIVSTKKWITIYNSNNKYSKGLKKYTKKGIKQMKESLEYMN